MARKIINIAQDWSRSPTGRYPSDGKSNGTDFKKRMIIPFLKDFDEFFVDLDGTYGYGSSFLDEAFAGLVRDGLMTKEEFRRKFIFKSEEDPSFIDEIFSYVGI